MNHPPQAASALLPPFAAALTILLAGAPASVLAAQANAGITELSFTLIDLTPDDGITPELIFTRGFDWVGGSSGSAYVTRNDSAGSQVRDEDRYDRAFSSNAFLTPGAASAALEGTRAEASSLADAFQAQANASLPATSTDRQRTATASVSALATGMPAGLLLSANTALLVQGRYNASASIDLDGSHLDRAWAQVTLDIIFGGANGVPVQQGLLSKVVQAGHGIGISPVDMASGEFSFRFVNEGPTALAGAFGNRDAYASVSMASAVPEPGSWALSLLGLAIGSALTARRQASRPSKHEMG